MHIKIDAALLAKNLKNTGYIVSKFKEESALACVHLRTDKNTVIVTLSNDNDKAIINLPCSVIEQGECYVTAHKFIGAIQSFVDEVELYQQDKIFTIKQGKIKINLPTVQSGIYSTAFSNFQSQCSFTIDGCKFNNMISIVSPFVDVTMQNIISGINIQVQNNWIKMQACHNAAMAVSTHKCECDDNCNVNLTLKVETLQAIGRLFADEDIVVSIADRTIQFVGETCTLFTRVLSGNFPPIEKLVEKDKVCAIKLNRQLLEKCLRRILIVKTLNKRIDIDITDNTMLITYEKALQESFDNIEQLFDNVRLAVNYELLLDALRVFNGAVLTIEITPMHKLKIIDENNIISICPLC